MTAEAGAGGISTTLTATAYSGAITARGAFRIGATPRVARAMLTSRLTSISPPCSSRTSGALPQSTILSGHSMHIPPLVRCEIALFRLWPTMATLLRIVLGLYGGQVQQTRSFGHKIAWHDRLKSNRDGGSGSGSVSGAWWAYWVLLHAGYSKE